MEPIGYFPYYEKPEILAEIDIRGRFMMMSCDIEWTLLNIMLYSSDDPNNHHRVNKFEGKNMNEKIQNAVCDLKRYHPSCYEEYKFELGLLMEFKAIRNDLAHYRLIFEDETLQSFKMQYVGNDGEEERVMYKTYIVSELKSVINQFRNANLKLAELVAKLYNGYKEAIKQAEIFK